MSVKTNFESSVSSTETYAGEEELKDQWEEF